MAKQTAAELVLAADAEVPEEGVDENLWIPTPGVPAAGSSVEEILTNAKVSEILRLMSEEVLLIEPTLRFVRLKAAEIADAKLRVLYGDKEVDAMKAELIASEGEA